VGRERSPVIEKLLGPRQRLERAASRHIRFGLDTGTAVGQRSTETIARTVIGHPYIVPVAQAR
jgi:hypothetical protein